MYWIHFSILRYGFSPLLSQISGEIQIILAKATFINKKFKEILNTYFNGFFIHIILMYNIKNMLKPIFFKY